ncbi:hypothetical protein [Qipengyuania sp. SM2507]
MFGPDPIDFFDPSPYGPLAYYGHMLIGVIALSAAMLAFLAIKGGQAHRIYGYIYIVAVGVVCFTSITMLRNVFIPPLFMAVFTAVYCIGGAWLALRRRSSMVIAAEAGLTIFEIIGLVIFLHIALGAVADGLIPPFAPYVIAAIPVILLIGDFNWFFRQTQWSKLRLSRHLSRMIWGFVVVLRAPLVELAAAGLPIPQFAFAVGPIILASAMIWYFRHRILHGALRTVRNGTVKVTN